MMAATRGGERSVAEMIYEYPLEFWKDVQGSRLKSHDFFVAALDLAAIRWRYGRRRATRPDAPLANPTQPAHREAA
jgi:hypothetical protein